MKAQDTRILDFLGGWNKSFVIPPFQRNYEWDKDECVELFNDILESLKTDTSHYLGNIIYYEGDNSGATQHEFILIDGQQRVTSILLLLCAIRDLLKDDKMRKDIENQYLINNNSTNSYRIRLKQTIYDGSNFESIIEGKEPKDMSSHIARNYKLFKDLISSSKYKPIEILNAIPKMQIVHVNLQVNNDLRAVQTVFEKINSTGKELTNGDKIRNFLLIAKDSKEQERLYNSYWVEIEKQLKPENISRFAKDFLIMKSYKDTSEKKVYDSFKKVFEKPSREDNLKEMLEMSKFYKWLCDEDCPNNEINRHLILLNLLSTSDTYPLYMYLLKTMYNVNSKELLQILKLFVDFYIRYRIVKPSGGGGALRSVINAIIENLDNKTLEFTRDCIHTELSNSPTFAGRFPTDAEFKEQLEKSVDTTYARVLLYKIEETETKNIPVNIQDITIEHLMPQTLSAWWRRYLGGDLEAERIQTTYLNCIGNLAPISQRYNSTVSNNPWSEKLEELQNVQFRITNEITKYTEWKESEIEDRNQNIAIRALNAITAPKKRTRNYINTPISNTYEAGEYSFIDNESSLEGSTPISIIFDKKKIQCNAWRYVPKLICLELIKIDKELFNKTVSENVIHKANKTKNKKEFDPVFTAQPQDLIDPKRIDGTDYYFEGCLGSGQVRKYMKQLLDLYNMTDVCMIEVI